MALLRALTGWMTSSTLVLLVCTGCAGQAPTAQRYEELAILPPSKVDSANQYSSVVVLTRVNDQQPYCSGVLIRPQLVLTAAHCVCKTHKRGKAPKTFVRDASLCERQAAVRTAVYGSNRAGGKEVSEPYLGEVIPHPDFRVVLEDIEVEEAGAVGNNRKATRLVVVEREADLAFVRLDQPVAGIVSYAALHSQDVAATQPITVTGFGADEVNVQGECQYRDPRPTRRFGSNTVTEKAPNGKTFKIERTGALSACGDSGGGAFVQGKLIGILSTALMGESSTYTDLRYYTPWIEGVVTKI